jgi:hypothetical protein
VAKSTGSKLTPIPKAASSYVVGARTRSGNRSVLIRQKLIGDEGVSLRSRASSYRVRRRGVTRFDWLLVFLTLLTFVGDDLELQSSAAVSTGKPPQKSETPVGGSSALIGVVLWRRLPVIS